MVLNKRVKLEGSKEQRITKALEIAGWFSGRCVDISLVEEYYRVQGAFLTEPAKSFFREYYGLAGKWYSKHNYDSNKPSAQDIDFFLFPDEENLYDLNEYLYEDISGKIIKGKDVVEYSNAKNTAQEAIILVGKIGYYYPGLVFIGESGKFYMAHDYEDEVRVFNSLLELIERELERHDFDYVTVVK